MKIINSIKAILSIAGEALVLNLNGSKLKKVSHIYIQKKKRILHM